MFEVFRQLLPALVIVAIVGAGLVAGLLAAFSNFVMRALSQLPAESGMQAMQRINVAILNLGFLAVFLGTAVVCALVLVLVATAPATAASAWLGAGAVAYLAGPLGVTAFGNVPLNEKLAAVPPRRASTEWPAYVRAWKRWNHLRALLGAAAVAFFAIGLYRL